MSTVDSSYLKTREPRYARIAGTIEEQIRNATLRPGDRLPSLRSICTEHGVSMNTALQAFHQLEARGFILSKPQSGYYVALRPQQLPEIPATSNPQLTYGREDVEEIIDAITHNHTRGEINFAQGVPDMRLMPGAKLKKVMVEAMRTLPGGGILYSHEGSLLLKRQIARRTPQWGGHLQAKDIIPTSGGMEAIALSMMATTEPGDTIAVESPVFYGILQLARNLRLKVLELPTHPITGVELPALEKALKQHKVKLCLLISNFSNPIGSCMPEEHKRETVRLLQFYNVPLIEDDLYGDLHFGNQRPGNCKAYDESGLVLWCSSFSKTLAGGYRVGWVSAGRYAEKVTRFKRYFSISTNTLAHEAIGLFLEHERYEAHLRKLRQVLESNHTRYLQTIREYFPEGTRVSQPQGGYFLWVELPDSKSALQLYDRAIQQKISIAPGSMYTLQKQYQHCFRLNYGLLWEPAVEKALQRLGKMAE